METEVEERSGATWIAIRGQLDAATAPALDERLGVLVDGGCRQIVFDLSALEYLSSAGLACFFAVAKRVEPDGGSLVFVSPQEFVARVFEIAGVAKLYRICTSADEV